MAVSRARLSMCRDAGDMEADCFMGSHAGGNRNDEGIKEDENI